uniref:BTB domain-containing protein n=1 Tax=Macrostomum lignano TaxID=282301 RepID=A0A1I8H143_9PLAT
SQPPSGRASDPYVSLYLKFEPQTLAESASCSVEFAVRLAGPSGRSVERRSAGRRQFDQRDSCRGWARFARASELEALAFSINGVKHLKLSGVLQVFDASQFLYPERRHNFARCQMGADFRLRVQLATFHVHRAVLALNSDYFAALLARPDSLESRQGQVVLSEDRIQDVHLMLQFMYPGYADVLDDETLKPLSRLAAKYQVHSLAWSCMQYIDSKLGEHPAPDAERISLYYFVCQESLQCPDLAEQCVRIAASLPWRGGLREARHFRELDETRKAAFLQAYLDFKDEMQFSTPGSEQLPTMPPPLPPPTSAVAKNASQKAGDNNSLSSDTVLPAEDDGGSQTE